MKWRSWRTWPGQGWASSQRTAPAPSRRSVATPYARADRKGRFELSSGGTIFLDEIGDVDPSAQAKLLRVLDDPRTS